MDKRISAAFVIMLFMLGTFTAPVSAHFTLGNLTSSIPYRTNDWTHVPGVIGYVWPGGAGSAWTLGQSAQYPGYQSPWPNTQPAGLHSTFYQLQSGYYAPFGAILTSTIKAGTPFNKMKVSGSPTIETTGTWVEGTAVALEHANKGDLVFAINATLGYVGQFVQVVISIPPEFTGIARKKVVCSWTNNYDMVTVSTSVMESLIDPGWSRVSIMADPHFPITFSADGEWYYVRINDVTAPTIAGRYFFKIFLASVASGYGYPLPYLSTDPAWTLDECPPQNWPVLLVKGEVDPGIITGTIRYGGWNTAYYGQPAELSGRVRAVGIADDPYTGKSTGRPVEARAYFNNTAKGHYEIEGVAPGTYDVYASLAGYPELKIASSVKVLKGQSVHADGYLTPGVVIHGEVFSKCGTGEVNWVCSDWKRRDAASDGTNPAPGGRYYYWFSDLRTASDQPIKIEIYKSADDALATTPASTSTKAISWSPIHRIHYNTIPLKQFAWPGYANGPIGFDPDGVGPSQRWRVESARFNFVFRFGDKGLYGAPAEWTGHIPQTYATWVDGVAPGTYFMRAWTHGYLQTEADGVTFHHVTFTVASYEWPGDVYVPFDLRLGSWIVKEFHLHNVPGSLEDNGFVLPFRGVWNSRIPAYVRYLYVEVKDAAGTRVGWAVRQVSENAGASERVVGVRGLVGRISTSGFLPYGRSYGIPAGTYIATGFAAGYVDQKPATVSIGLCGTEVRFSDHLDRGAWFNLTVYSVDWEHPSAYKYWSWPGENIYIMPYKDGKALAGTSYGYAGINYDDPEVEAAPPPPSYDGDEGTSAVSVSACYWGMPIIMQPAWGTRNYVKAPGYYGGEGYYTSTERPGYKPLAFETGSYSFKVFTYGYVQKKPFEVYAVKGATADIPIKVHQGANVTFDIAFKRESIFEHLRYDSAVRIRLFNDKDVLVGEALTSDYTKMYVNAPNTNPDLKVMTGPTKTYSFPTRQLEAISAYIDVHEREYLNYVPSCTTRLRGIIGGLPDLYSGGDNYIDWFNGYSPDPFFDMSWTGSPVAAPYGIDAYPNYKGGWYIEVDIVPWYSNAFQQDLPFVRRTVTATGTSAVTTETEGIYVTTSVSTSTDISSGLTSTTSVYTSTAYSTWITETASIYYTTYLTSTDAITFTTSVAISTSSYITAITSTSTGVTSTTIEYSTTETELSVLTSIYGTTEVTTIMSTVYTTSAWTTQALDVHSSVFFPPPPGLLTGESPKYIPENHFGPYEQRRKVVVPGAHLGGEASVVFELDLRGLVQGNVYAYTHCGDWRTASWVTILALGADGKEYRWYSFDGIYEMWMTPGTYTLHVIPWTPTIQEGHKVATLPGFAVSEGSVLAMNFYLEQSGVPIPEFPVTAIVLASALAASLFILRRRRK